MCIGKRRAYWGWCRLVWRRPHRFNDKQHNKQAGKHQWKRKDHHTHLVESLWITAQLIIYAYRSTSSAAQQQLNKFKACPAVCWQPHLGTILTFPFIEPFFFQLFGNFEKCVTLIEMLYLNFEKHSSLCFFFLFLIIIIPLWWNNVSLDINPSHLCWMTKAWWTLMWYVYWW